MNVIKLLININGRYSQTDFAFKRYTLICGHYGCGKTNLSMNIALDLAGRGEGVTLADMDIVNPYFRSSDYAGFLASRGIRVIAPGSAGTTLDVPALSAEIASTFETGSYVIIDVGGDDAGATALGRFAPNISEIDYDMLYVVNKYRPLTSVSGEAAVLLREIEAASRLRATGVINNSHLMGLTTVETVASTFKYAEETALRLNLPLRFHTAPREIAAALKGEKIYPIDIYVKTPWQQER